MRRQWPYLGPLGALVKVTATGAIRSASADLPMTTRTTIGGRVLAQVGSRVRHGREVELTPSTPDEVAVLQSFVEGEFGRGPFWWVDPWAQSTNVIPPRIAALGGGVWPNTVAGGPLSLGADAVAGRSLVVASASTVTYLSDGGQPVLLPYVPGVPATASAWLSSAGQGVRLEARDATGATVASAASTLPADGLARLSATVTPPTGAHHLRVAFTGGGRIARPALTWTDQVMPYHGGQGMASVVVTGIAQDVRAYSDGFRASGAVVLTEVG